MDERRRAAEFWDREIAEQSHVSWMEAEDVRHYIHESIGGAATPMGAGDWFMQHIGGRTFRRGLSIGCGVGNLEREALRRGLCDRIDAFDGSLASLGEARSSADGEGYGARIGYFVSDFNRPALPKKRYDIVFFNQSLHHVEQLETLFPAILEAMTDDAVMYVDEYIGPSRTDWNDALIAPHRCVFLELPEDVRRGGELPLPIQADDPSEAVRSSEILRELRVGFDVEALRGYGGNLLAVLFPQIRWDAAPHELRRGLIARDRQMASVDPYYAVLVARPKRGVRRRVAMMRWALHRRARRRA